MPLITGITIYIPLLFIKNIAIATSLGVGMHWCQYISLMWFINARKNKEKEVVISTKNFTFKHYYLKFVFTLGYSLIMSYLTINGVSTGENLLKSYRLIYLIPILFHLYHFYIDGYIWKFSDIHIKTNVLPFIFSK